MSPSRPTPPDIDPPGDGAPEAGPPGASAPESGEADPREHGWIRRAKAGEEEAFEALVRAHQGRAYAIARSLVPSEEDARDLVQEAFLRVFRNLERFDFQHPFATWLHRIVTNLAIDHLRRRRLVQPVGGSAGGEAEGEERELLIADEADTAPSQRLEAQETAQAVREVIASLAPHFQAVLVLRELQGLPCTEIASIVGATHVTVRWRLHRGRKLFQEEWERRERLAAARRRREPSHTQAGEGRPNTPRPGCVEDLEAPPSAPLEGGSSADQART